MWKREWVPITAHDQTQAGWLLIKYVVEGTQTSTGNMDYYVTQVMSSMWSFRSKDLQTYAHKQKHDILKMK